MAHSTHIQPTDEFLEYFDAMTQKLRKTALEAVKILSDIKNPPVEIQDMKSSLTHLHSVNIEELDIAIEELTHALNLFNLRLKEKKFIEIISPKTIQKITKKQNELLQELYDLLEKGDALDRSAQK